MVFRCTSPLCRRHLLRPQCRSLSEAYPRHSSSLAFARTLRLWCKWMSLRPYALAMKLFRYAYRSSHSCLLHAHIYIHGIIPKTSHHWDLHAYGPHVLIFKSCFRSTRDTLCFIQATLLIFLICCSTHHSPTSHRHESTQTRSRFLRAPQAF